MKKNKIIIRSFIIFIITLSLFFISSNGSVVYAFNCYIISFSDFKEISKNVYVEPDTANREASNILNTISKSKDTVAQLYGNFNAKPVFIISKI